MNKFILSSLVSSVIFLSSQSAMAEQDSRVATLKSYFKQCHKAQLCNGSFLVAEDGKVLYHQAMGVNHKGDMPLSTSHQFDIGSISKQFTAVAIMMLQEQGKLNFEDKVIQHIPDFPYEQITIKHLLNHTSGIADMMPYLTSLYRQGKVTASLDQNTVLDALIDQAPEAMFQPGAQWRYSNTGYVVLATLVSKISKQSYGEFLQSNIFTPLKMAQSVSRTSKTEHRLTERAYGFRQQINGTQRTFDQIPFFDIEGMGGIYSTTSDLYAWDQALHSHKLLSPKTWKSATQLTKTTDGKTKEYGFGFMLKPDAFNQQKVGHSGHWRAFKSIYTRQVEDNRTIILLTNSGQDDSVDANEKAVDAILAGQAYEFIQQPISQVLYGVFKQDINKALSTYHQLKADQAAGYDFSEGQLNDLGYVLLQEEHVQAAIAAFELNVEAFPKSPNALDSLAEALISNGQKRAATKRLKQALEIDSNFASAKQQLAKLNDAKL